MTLRADALRAIHYLEGRESDPSVEQYADAVLEVVREALIDSMTPPVATPGGLYWLGAQWAYGQVRDVLEAPLEN